MHSSLVWKKDFLVVLCDGFECATDHVAKATQRTFGVARTFVPWKRYARKNGCCIVIFNDHNGYLTARRHVYVPNTSPVFQQSLFAYTIAFKGPELSEALFSWTIDQTAL